MTFFGFHTCSSDIFYPLFSLFSFGKLLEVNVGHPKLIFYVFKHILFDTLHFFTFCSLSQESSFEFFPSMLLNLYWEIIFLFSTIHSFIIHLFSKHILSLYMPSILLWDTAMNKTYKVSLLMMREEANNKQMHK